MNLRRRVAAPLGLAAGAVLVIIVTVGILTAVVILAPVAAVTDRIVAWRNTRRRRAAEMQAWVARLTDEELEAGLARLLAEDDPR